LQKPSYLNWLLENVGWLPARQDIDYSDVVDKIPQFSGFMYSDPQYKGFGYIPIGSFDEVMTKLAERLVAAFLDKNLSDNPEGIAQIIQEAADETNRILKRAGIYAGE